MAEEEKKVQEEKPAAKEKKKPTAPKPKKKVVKKAKPKKPSTEPKEKEEKVEKKPVKKIEKEEAAEEEVVEVEEEGAEEEEAEEEEKAAEEEIEIVEEEEYKVKIKPKLSDKQKKSLHTRSNIKRRTPRYKKLGEAWRKPRGLHSKMRKHKGYRQNVVSIGYGSPSSTRNLHPSGFEEVMVYNVKDLEKINPKSQAARVGHSVGTRKRIEIEATAEEKGIRVLNPRRL
jgi:large subunit ribosomal protein L32e